MIKCLVVDDEKHAIEILTHYIEKMPVLTLAYSTTESLEAFQYVQSNPVDLIFLDIQMPHLQGLQFLKLLGGKSKVILTTAYPEYALEGYEHDILDYLLKPIMFDRFLKAVQKIMNHMNAHQSTFQQNRLPAQVEEDYFFVKTDGRGKISKIKIRDILYIEALGNYTCMHMLSGKILTLLTMKEIEAQLPVKYFIRIHKSYTINITKIDAIDGNQVFINQSPLPVGDTYKEYLFSFISDKTIRGKR
ncbi:MAG: response regulator transcription factor [Flavisolibacter sp.]|nr:response regulator transcription factor [Flavisolibacter sp.]MBD0367427.1 response regulator transcription factor [Flavisolibacter sp.]